MKKALGGDAITARWL